MFSALARQLAITLLITGLSLAQGAKANPTRAKKEWGPAQSHSSSGRALAAADFNGDSYTDIAVATATGIDLYLADANASLRQPKAIHSEAAYTLATADFNQDGHADLALATSHGITLLHGDGQGQFPSRQDIAAPSPKLLHISDTNLIAASSKAIEVYSIEGRSLRFERRHYLSQPISSLTAADFNSDGRLDVAAALEDQPKLLLWLDDKEPTTIEVPAIATALGVLQQDGPAHLTLRLNALEHVHVMPNQGDATFTAPLPAPGLILNTPSDLIVDLNNDAAPDHVFLSANNGISVQPRAASITSISKTHEGNWSAGMEEATFTIQLSGSGRPVVTDTLPTGMSLANVFGGGWECFYNEEQPAAPFYCEYLGMAVTNAPFPPLYVTVNIAPDAPNVMVNTVTEAGGAQTTDTVVLGPPSPKPNLTISKTHTGNFMVGQTHIYTLIVTNVGAASTIGDVTVSEFPPTGLTVASMNGSGWACTIATLTCTRPDSLAPGASFPDITVSVTVALDAAPFVDNYVEVQGGGDTTPNNNGALDTTTILKPDLRISKSHTGNFYRGQTGAQFTLTVTNVGGAPTNAPVSVLDALPSALTATAMAGSGWACTLATLTCTRSDVLQPAAAYPPITLSVNVGPLAPATVTNNADVSGGGDGNPLNNSTSDTATVDRIDLTISKTHSGVFPGGSRATYTILVTNAGAIASTGTVTVADPLVASLVNPAISGPGWTCQTSPTPQCSRSDSLAPGASFPAITFAADVVASPPASFTNTTTVSGGGDDTPANNTANDPTSTEGADLSIEKTHSGDFRLGQQGAVWTIVVSNVGGAATSGEVRVNEWPQSGFPGPTLYTIASLSGNGWTCFVGASNDHCTRTDSLASGASYPPITVSVNIMSVAGLTQIGNEASVVYPGDTNTANNRDTDGAVVLRPDLSITKTHTGNFHINQQNAAFTINVSNVGGASTIGEVRVTDFPPSGGFGPPAAYVISSFSGSGWSCTVAAESYCTRSDALAPGASYPPLTVNGTVTYYGAYQGFENRARVTGGADENTSNNETTDGAQIDAPDLRITKSHTGNFRQGQPNAAYTISVTNIGTYAAASLVTVEEQLPANAFTNLRLSGTGWTCAATTCTRSDTLAIGASYPPITALVDVLLTAPANATNVVNLTLNQDRDGANNTAQDPTIIESGSVDLAIDKSHTGDFRLGQQGATWSIVVSNVGSTHTSGEVRVNEWPQSGFPGPALYTITSLSGSGWTCFVGASNDHCTRTDSLAPGASYPPITVSVNILNVAGLTQVGNEASVVAAGDTNTSNNRDTDGAVVLRPDLSITKTHTGNFHINQQNAAFTINVSNVGGASTIGEVRVTDFPPSGGFGPPPAYVISSFSGSGWACTVAAESYCTRSDALAPGASYPPLTVNGTISSYGAIQGFENRARVSGGSDDNTSNNETTDGAQIDAPDLRITKSHTGNFRQGQPNAAYTINVTNLGTYAASSLVTVEDQLPANAFTNLRLSGTGWTCAATTCTRSDNLAVGASYPPITALVDVLLTAPANATNVANLTLNQDRDGANNTAQDPTVIESGSVDLAIDKSHTGDFRIGQIGATWTIVVSNVGSTHTSGEVRVNEYPQSGFPGPTLYTIASLSGTGWTCFVGASNHHCTRTDALAPGASYPPITVTVNIANVEGITVLGNEATVVASGDANSNNNRDSDGANVLRPDLTIDKSHTGNFQVGQIGATWTIVVSNIGAAATAGEVRVDDSPDLGFVVPAPYTLTSMSGTGWSCNVGGGQFYCARTDALAAGASYPPITVRVNISGAPQSFSATNGARVTSLGDSNTGNNNDNDVAQIVAPDLILSKTHSGNFIQGQANARFTLTVTNQGNAATSGTVTVDEVPPASLSSLVLSGAGWTCAGTRCTRSDSLAAGASFPSIIVTATVSLNAPAQITNTAQVQVTGEANLLNNQANDIATVTPQLIDLRINKSHNGNFSQGQVGALYVISVTNIGTSPSAGVVSVVDALPAGLTAASISGPGWACALATLTCTRADALVPGANYAPINVVVNVAANAPPTVTNNATVSGGGDSVPANNSANDVTTVSQTSLNVTLAAGAITFNRALGMFQQAITLTNNGAAITASAIALDALSAGSTLVNGNGVTAATAPAGSPYKELGAIPAGGSISAILNFTRVGVVPITYTPRILGAGPR